MLAEHKETKEKVALKIVHMPTIYEINKERHIYRERDILFQFSKARHVIELKETFVVGEESIVFVFEYLSNGDLETLINKLRGTARSKEFRGIGQELTKVLMAQLVNAIELLQDNEIMHRDLKPMNVMLDENYNVKLIDFGDAKKVNESIAEDQDYYEDQD